MKGKRFLGVFLIVILLVLSACNDKNNNKDTSKNPQKEVATPIPSTKEEKRMLQGTKMNATGSIVALDKLIGDDSTNLVFSAFFNSEKLLVMENINFEKFRIFLYDIYTGEIDKETEISESIDSVESVVLDNGNIFIKDIANNTYYLFDSQLKLIHSSKDKAFEYGTVVATKDGKELIYTDTQGYQIYSYDLVNMKNTLLWTAEKKNTMVYIQEISENGDTIIGSYNEGDLIWGILLLILEDKRVEYLEGADYSIHSLNNKYIISSYELTKQRLIEIYDPLKPREINRFLFDHASEADYFKFNEDLSQVFTICNNNHSTGDLYQFRLYDMESGNKVKQDDIKQAAQETEVEDTGLIFYAKETVSFSSDNSKVCVNYYLNNKMGIAVWDLDHSKEAVREDETDGFFYDNALVTRYDNDQIKSELEQKYHITIHLREEAVRFFPDFAVNSTSDEDSIHAGLKELGTALAKYPKDFFKDFTYGEIEGFEVFLCGTLVQGSDQGISYPGAFALTYDKKQMIVLDITNSTEIVRNFAHETMHAIDSRIFYLIENDTIKDTLSNRWLKLNPKGFEYHWGYVNEEGEEYNFENSGKYTMDDPDSENNFDNVYFIDYYSTTFPIEDRARVFETLMSSENELPNYFQSKKLMAKAKLLSEMIREALPSMRQVDEVYWERYLN